jgi:hypothetical protein
MVHAMEQERPPETRPAETPGEPGAKPVRTAHPGEAWTALSHLLTGILLFGGIGWAVDALLDLRGFTAAGLLVGAAASMYLIYVRYVKS